jgi:vacuolar-type H+-ATPase subunit I/STV1
MKKKSLKYIGIIFGVLALIGGTVVFAQWDNIHSYLMSKQYTDEELIQMLDDEKAEMQKVLEPFLAGDLRDLTAEEEFSIITGKMTVEEAEKAMNITDKEASGKIDDSTEGKDQKSVIIAKYTSQLYSIKASFLGQLSSIAATAESEFYSLPAKERTASAKSAVIYKYLGQVSSLESQCDSRVSSALSAMRSALNAIGADTSIVGQLQTSYETQKAAEKAYYLSQY